MVACVSVYVWSWLVLVMCCTCKELINSSPFLCYRWRWFCGQKSDGWTNSTCSTTSTVMTTKLWKENWRPHRKRIKKLKEQLKQSNFGFESIKDMNSKIVLFFIWLLSIIKRSTLVLKGGLSWENHLLLVLMKVRLGLNNRDLAYRFGLSFSTVSKILIELIPMLSSILNPLILWPSKDAVRANMSKHAKVF